MLRVLGWSLNKCDFPYVSSLIIKPCFASTKTGHCQPNPPFHLWIPNSFHVISRSESLSIASPRPFGSFGSEVQWVLPLLQGVLLGARMSVAIICLFLSFGCNLSKKKSVCWKMSQPFLVIVYQASSTWPFDWLIGWFPQMEVTQKFWKCLWSRLDWKNLIDRLFF